MNPETLQKLRPWQRGPAEQLLKILQKYDSALDASQTGVGKTFTALGVAKALQLPCLAVVPKIAISSWRVVAEHFGEKISIINYELLRTGNTLYGTWSNSASLHTGRRFTFVCCFCQRRFEQSELGIPCSANGDGIHCVERKARPKLQGHFQWNNAVKFVIFDECHRAGGIKSLNAELLIAAKRQKIKTLMLSATPAQNILQMRALGHSLDLHSDKQHPSFYTWLRRHGARPDPVFRGMKWFRTAEQQRATMAEIRSQIIPARGVRITTDEIPGFPAVDIQSMLCDIDDVEKIEKNYETIKSALSEIRARAATDKSPGSAITRILRSRQEIELLKVPAALEIAADRLECGYSIGVFCNFRATVVELARRLECGFIDGSVTGASRDKIIADFQANKTRAIVLNSEAGGISINLQDLDGNHPRFGVVFPPWSATTFKQLIGRFPRDGGKSKSHFRVMFAAKTIETKMHAALKLKLDNLDSLTDGDMQPENLKIT